jgi:hypothetical protein
MRDLGFLPRGIEAGLRREVDLLAPAADANPRAVTTVQPGNS